MDYLLDPRIPEHPNWKKLTRSAVDVYLMMFRLACRKDGDIYFSYARARDDLGVSRSTFARAKEQLVKLEFIEVATRGGLRRRASVYRLLLGGRDLARRKFCIEESPEMDRQERLYRRRLATLTDSHRFTRARNLEKGRGSRS